MAGREEADPIPVPVELAFTGKNKASGTATFANPCRAQNPGEVPTAIRLIVASPHRAASAASIATEPGQPAAARRLLNT